MRLIIIVVLALLFAASVPGQMPSLKINGENGQTVVLQKLDVDVKITGAVARTTWTMTFRNNSNRLLEGELNFPLPQGTSVSHYALDINGRLRDAVPVEKEKATLAFENTERRRIDPGLLEKVDGNTFRTRIYPINANGTRTVRIGYEQELVWERQADLRYRLPLDFPYAIGSFSININVMGVGHRPKFDGETDESLQFGEWNDSWTAARSWSNYQADKSIEIRIPQPPGAGAVLMQQAGNHYYYVASAFPQQKKLEKTMPRHITLLWDVSLSGLKRDLKKELGLLNAYFSRLNNVEVTLVEFSNTVKAPQQFFVRNGRWAELNKQLSNTVFDGATQFGVLDPGKYPGDEFLLFSDGHSNFGSNNIKPSSHPIYTITSSANTDYPFLESIASRSGGELINLENVSVSAGCDLLFYQTLRFMGVKPAEGLGESYPSLPTPVTGSLNVAGICYHPEATLVLQFGYGGKVVSEQKIGLDYSRQRSGWVERDGGGEAKRERDGGVAQERNGGAAQERNGGAAQERNGGAAQERSGGVDLEHIWAQKKIAELDTRYDDNKLEIRHLGRRYGIVTRNTSLIVLENINDYITYQIEPPAELREQYDHLMKGRVQTIWLNRRQVTENAEKYFNELLGWWGGTPEKQVTALEDRVEGASVMSEVVVMGYGVQRKRTVSASATTVRGYDLDGQPRSGGERQPREGERRSREGERQPRGEEMEESPRPGADGGSFTALKAEVNTSYLDKLKAVRPAERYRLYLQLRRDNMTTPLFYFHTAGLFLAQGDKAVGLTILSNIAELETENYELCKLLAYKLKELGESEAELAAFEKVADWRPFEPQSYRDYGLALADAGHYQRALDTLYYALTKNYDANINALYPGIEETLLPEINNLIARQKGKLDISRIPRNLIAPLPVDIRVVLNWNRPSTDIDLWVTDPDNERCYYGHRYTAMGGRISQDFTRGLGPEQFLLKKAMKGRYKLEVNYYGDTQVKLAGETSIMVEVYTNYGSPQQQRTIITLQMERGAKGAVYVGDFDFK